MEISSYCFILLCMVTGMLTGFSRLSDWPFPSVLSAFLPVRIRNRLLAEQPAEPLFFCLCRGGQGMFSVFLHRQLLSVFFLPWKDGAG